MVKHARGVRRGSADKQTDTERFQHAHVSARQLLENLRTSLINN